MWVLCGLLSELETRTYTFNIFIPFCGYKYNGFEYSAHPQLWDFTGMHFSVMLLHNKLRFHPQIVFP